MKEKYKQYKDKQKESYRKNLRMNRWDISDNTDDDYHNINLSSDDEKLTGYQKIRNLFRKKIR